MRIETKRKEISNCNMLTVEAGTNCPKDGDSGHGGRTYLKLQNDGATVWELNISNENGERIKIDNPVTLEISMGGDAEFQTLLEALKFAVKVLEDQYSENDQNVTCDHKDIDF